jgi:hypothetical protein
VDLLDAQAEAPHLLKNLVGRIDPPEWCAALIVLIDVGEDGRS